MIRLDDHDGKFDKSINAAKDLEVSYLVQGEVYPNNLVDLVQEYLHEHAEIDHEDALIVRGIAFEALYLQKLHIIRAVEKRIDNLKHFEL